MEQYNFFHKCKKKLLKKLLSFHLLLIATTRTTALIAIFLELPSLRTRNRLERLIYLGITLMTKVLISIGFKLTVITALAAKDADGCSKDDGTGTSLSNFHCSRVESLIH